MVEKIVQVTNKSGLHARPAANFVKEAMRFRSKIFLELNGKKADAKSILGIMGIGATNGSVVKIYAEGEDEQTAAESLANLVSTFVE